MAKKRRQYQPVEELTFDPSPLYWCDVRYDEDTCIGVVIHDMAFDPVYGPENERQLEYWRNRGYPGSDSWEVGKPIQVANAHAAEAAMIKAART